jgi:hypothetical protein
MLARDKHSSLFGLFVSVEGRRFFIKRGPVGSLGIVVTFLDPLLDEVTPAQK